MQNSPEPSTELDLDMDTDSAIGDDQSVFTETLRSSLLESVKENSRGYHRYQDGRYLLPDDEKEQQRLDMQHHIFSLTFDDRLVLAPIDTPIHHAIDLGTGTGIWAIDYADRHPETHVVGIDLSPIQPTLVPPNCKFEVDDFDKEWTFPQKFDLVHGRMLLTSTPDFPALLKQCYKNMAPGGWVEFQDVSLPFECDDDTMKGTALESWLEDLWKACTMIGRDPGWTQKYKECMIEIGFERVEEQLFKWPIGSWPKDKFLKRLGNWNSVNMMHGLEGFTNRPFTTVLGKSIEDVELLLAEVKREIQTDKIHAVWPIHVIYGKKPFG